MIPKAHQPDEISSDTNFFKEIGPDRNCKIVNDAKFIAEAVSIGTLHVSHLQFCKKRMIAVFE